MNNFYNLKRNNKMVVIKLISDNFKLKKPKKFEKNIFKVYSTSKYDINEADTITIDTDLLIDGESDNKTFSSSCL